MNLDYYYKVFQNRPDKMRQMREAIIHDFRENEHVLSKAVQAHDSMAMRKALHNMIPIAEALQYKDLIQTILAFKEVGYEPVAVQSLMKKMRGELTVLYNFIKTSE